MKRRTFIAGVGTTTALFLAGCNSSGNETSTKTGTGETTGTTSTTGTESTSSTTDGTTSEQPDGTTTDGTTSGETTTESSGTTAAAKTVSFGKRVTISDGLDVAVTKADVSDTYQHGGTTETAADGKTFLLATFETKNSGGSSRSLPDDATVSVRANGREYSTTDAAAKKWTEYVSSEVKPGGSSSVTVAFEVPKDAVSSLGVKVALTYTDSGSKRRVRWSME